MRDASTGKLALTSTHSVPFPRVPPARLHPPCTTHACSAPTRRAHTERRMRRSVARDHPQQGKRGKQWDTWDTHPHAPMETASWIPFNATFIDQIRNYCINTPCFRSSRVHMCCQLCTLDTLVHTRASPPFGRQLVMLRDVQQMHARACANGQLAPVDWLKLRSR